MKTLAPLLFAGACLTLLSSCDTVEYEESDVVRSRTTVTEETVRTDPYTGAVQTQTTRTTY